ncbi:MAG: hypothetical protein GY827_07570 [Cytophagales bacterium]|nr:hypothetical protein [Cytophagales bacterium]
MKYLLSSLVFLSILSSCNTQVQNLTIEGTANTSSMIETTLGDTSNTQLEIDSEELTPIEQFYQKYSIQNITSSESRGTVSNGSLHNGVLMPYTGKNYKYFDTSSYLAKRAFTNIKVRDAVVQTYQKLEPNNRQYQIMECSHEHGGKLYPHRTHQNGLSVDFMMPLIKNNQPYYDLDNTGKNHYWLDFDNDGKYSEDQTVSIDFDAVVEHLLTLNKTAKQNGLAIAKVIIKVELKDELFAAKCGKELKNSGIYIVQKLGPLINSLHDEHYHIDFKEEVI